MIAGSPIADWIVAAATVISIGVSLVAIRSSNKNKREIVAVKKAQTILDFSGAGRGGRGGDGQIAGVGGSGGNMTHATFPAHVLPNNLKIQVGEGGSEGQNGGDSFLKAESFELRAVGGAAPTKSYTFDAMAAIGAGSAPLCSKYRYWTAPGGIILCFGQEEIIDQVGVDPSLHACVFVPDNLLEQLRTHLNERVK